MARGKAPHGLTFIFGSLSEGGPFLVYEKGVKIPVLTKVLGKL
ncbi:MAG: hypothetical protein RDV48_08200 [Candidatus Eremiobacteraeota bacterium]|nr:hypothetical protein [Candidatus Eremiobacteraeota bacterium]